MSKVEGGFNFACAVWDCSGLCPLAGAGGGESPFSGFHSRCKSVVWLLTSLTALWGATILEEVSRLQAIVTKVAGFERFHHAIMGDALKLRAGMKRMLVTPFANQAGAIIQCRE